MRAFWSLDRKRYFTKGLELLEQRIEGRRLLDIGGGVGFFTEVALERGWDAYSLDTSSAATALAGERLGPRALSELTSEQQHSFDAVSLWCVVAHTDRPSAVLSVVTDAIAPRGVVWLTTPNFAFEKRYVGLRRLVRRPISFAHEDHISHFSPRSLAVLLRRHGFGAPAFAYCGVPDVCHLAGFRSAPLIAAKKVWNRAAHSLTGIGAPNMMSELQALAVSSRRHSPAPR